MLSIDDISPGDSEFTVTSRVIIYWRKSDCNQTSLHQLACDTRLNNGNGVRFIRSTTSKGTPSLGGVLYVPDINEQVFVRNGQTDLQPDAELISGQTTFSHRFDMRNFPFEFHALNVSSVSAYSDNVVSLTSFDVDPAALNPTVPPGWTLQGVQCEVNKSNKGRTNPAVPTRPFHSYDCVIYVSRRNPSWWLTSFLLFAGLIFMSFVGSLGVMSHEVAEARDDKDSARRALFAGTRFMGTYTLGLILTYVFQVEDSPYGRPIEYWAELPTSSMIYILGLITLLVLASSGMIGAMLFKLPLVREGFRGEFWQCYAIDKLPVEGREDESRQPLLLKKYAPEASEHGVTDKSNEGEEAILPEVGGQESAPQSGVARGRKNNQKNYNVLSIEEAILVNRFVLQIFLLKLAIILVVMVCTLSIILTAKNRFDDAIAAV